MFFFEMGISSFPELHIPPDPEAKVATNRLRPPKKSSLNSASTFLALVTVLLSDSCTILFLEGVIIGPNSGISFQLKKCGSYTSKLPLTL